MYTVHHGIVRKHPQIILSIDPALKNLAIRLENRIYNPLNITTTTLVFNTLSIDEPIYDSITHYLNSIPILLNADLIVIEKQLSRNYTCVRIAQHILSYFLIKCNSNTAIIEVNPKNKTRLLGYNSKDGNVKQWSINKALEILTNHCDYIGLEILKSARKKDDLADTVCQLEALDIVKL